MCSSIRVGLLVAVEGELAMAVGDDQPDVEDVEAMRKRLLALSGALNTTPRQQRAALLRRMWELSGHIAQVSNRDPSKGPDPHSGGEGSSVGSTSALAAESERTAS